MITNGDKINIQRLINENVSYEEIGRQYNVSGTTIKNWCKKMGIILTRRRKISPKETFNKGTTHIKIKRSKCIVCGKEFILKRGRTGKYCSVKCSTINKSKTAYEDFLSHPEKYYGRLNIHTFRKYIINEQLGKCAICGMEQIWNGQPITFIIDHINGRAYDNRRENLRCICPNCDSQLDTYKSKNKNSDRAYFRNAYQNSVAHARITQMD